MTREELIKQLEYSKLHFNDAQLTIQLNQVIKILERLKKKKVVKIMEDSPLLFDYTDPEDGRQIKCIGVERIDDLATSIINSLIEEE